MEIVNGISGDFAIFEVNYAFPAPIDIRDMSTLKVEIADLTVSEGDPTVTLTPTLRGGNLIATGEPLHLVRQAFPLVLLGPLFGVDVEMILDELDEVNLSVQLPVNSDISLTINSIAFVSGLASDYNSNGIVDAADYTVWRDNLGAPGGTMPNDTDGGVIGQAQYDTWKANFGMTAGSGSGSGSAGASPSLDASPSLATVPEPATALLLIVPLAALVLFSHRGRGGMMIDD